MTKISKIPTIKLSKEAQRALEFTNLSDEKLFHIMNNSGRMSEATRTQMRWMAAQILGQRYKLEP